MVRPSNCISFANGSISQPRQTGAPSLLLTLLILPTSPKAAFFFQGTLGSFMAYSQIGGAASAGGSPGPQGQAPGSYTPSQPSSNDNRRADDVRATSPQVVGSSMSQTPQAGSRAVNRDTSAG
ncbi:hypothetical protein D0A36_21675 [Xanthomonas campestris]|nr:hypothetical protein D0A36_21675 [Xanthomonas campestris]RFF53046.1 hypothetical protein D0A41_21625 [Xanthomonas campestris]